eukprot:TRINITY_DN79738_c0_g1_i1.p1 TRINITY_DN79738_c0_g1~~TRINITY_DN79738_c0_g1_i1.p1  ORF type:complete len:351 (-),score=54.11 TRINITY_DN79738_c0_g1_i1:17-1069(-)
MGNEVCSVKPRPCACSVVRNRNQMVTGTSDYDMPQDGSNVHMLIVTLDYKLTPKPLTSSNDGKNMARLARFCGVGDVCALYNESCTKAEVAKSIREVGRKCRPDDYFVFYFSGHGKNVKDTSGDESDGLDEAFVFVDGEGKITGDSIMTDDDFAQLVVDSVGPAVKVLILVDSCHSGTIADLSRPVWAGRQGISISGCRDLQTVGDMGRGGLFTHAMLLAVDKLGQGTRYSVGKLYNAVLKDGSRIFGQAQDVTIQCSSSAAPNTMAWPLIPRHPYQSPLRKLNNAINPATVVQREVDIGDYKDVPDELAEWAKLNGIDLGDDYRDDELENGWKAGKELLDKINQLPPFV